MPEREDPVLLHVCGCANCCRIEIAPDQLHANRAAGFDVAAPPRERRAARTDDSEVMRAAERNQNTTSFEPETVAVGMGLSRTLESRLDEYARAAIRRCLKPHGG